MPRRTPALGDNSSRAVQSIAQDPLAQWEPYDAGGYFVRSDDTDAGRLVRLRTVVLWLMKAKARPWVPAVALVCDALCAQPQPGVRLYLAVPGDYAQTLTPEYCFFDDVGFVDLDQADDPADCGVRGAIKGMRNSWAQSVSPARGEWRDDGDLERLAVPIDQAAALWGYVVAQVRPKAGKRS